MLSLFRKSIAAKYIPLLALALFAAVFVGNEVYASLVPGATTNQWLYNPTCGIPTDPNCYEKYDEPGRDLATDCVDEEEDLCGIEAEEDGTSGRPLIDPQSDLFTDLLNGTYSNNPHIFQMPYVAP